MHKLINYFSLEYERLLLLLTILGIGKAENFPRNTGFDITVASEIM